MPINQPRSGDKKRTIKNHLGGIKERVDLAKSIPEKVTNVENKLHHF